MHDSTNDEPLDAFFRPWNHCVEIQRVDCTSDVERFDDAAAMQARYDRIVEEEPEIVFVVGVADRRPVSAFRRDGHPSILSLSPERQKRSVYLCAGAQSRHVRRYGDAAILVDA